MFYKLTLSLNILIGHVTISPKKTRSYRLASEYWERASQSRRVPESSTSTSMYLC